MDNTKYEILINDEIIAQYMDIDVVAIVMKALLDHYYYETICIRRMACSQPLNSYPIDEMIEEIQD